MGEGRHVHEGEGQVGHRFCVHCHMITPSRVCHLDWEPQIPGHTCYGLHPLHTQVLLVQVLPAHALGIKFRPRPLCTHFDHPARLSPHGRRTTWHFNAKMLESTFIYVYLVV